MSRELVNEALRTMLLLESVCLHCATTSEGKLEKEPGTTEYTLKLVGDDWHRQGYIQRFGLADHVRILLGEPTEALYIGGKEYIRDPRYGEWLSEQKEWRPRKHLFTETQHMGIGSDLPEIRRTDVVTERQPLLFDYVLFQDHEFTSIGEEELNGRDVVHLRADKESEGPFPRPPTAAQARSFSFPGKLRDYASEDVRDSLSPEMRDEVEAAEEEAIRQIEEIRRLIPHAFRDTIDIWIDPATHFVHRCEWVHVSLQNDNVAKRVHIIRTFSHFNKAELPGPLPD